MKHIIASVCILFAFAFVQAQTVTVEQQMLRTTGFAVHSAHKAVLANGIYNGNLSKCIEHQRYAVIQYKSGNISLAVFHSARARNLAFSVIEANSSKVNGAFLFTTEEKALMNAMPSDSELDKILKDDLKDQNYLDPQLTGVDL
jgi:hypothetical protein